jgi:hypothetical protein
MRPRENLDDLETDLERLARSVMRQCSTIDLPSSCCTVNSVLESIRKVLRSHSDHRLRARIVRVIQRTDILGQIQEQDRRLDNLINAFQVLTFGRCHRPLTNPSSAQFKTSIILRRQDVPAASAPVRPVCPALFIYFLYSILNK